MIQLGGAYPKWRGDEVGNFTPPQYEGTLLMCSVRCEATAQRAFSPQLRSRTTLLFPHPAPSAEDGGPPSPTMRMSKEELPGAWGQRIHSTLSIKTSAGDRTRVGAHPANLAASLSQRRFLPTVTCVLTRGPYQVGSIERTLGHKPFIKRRQKGCFSPS